MLSSQPDPTAAGVTAAAATATQPPGRSLAASSQAAYDKDCALFLRTGGTVPCDAGALLRHVEAMRTRLSPRTLYRRLMAVAHAHRAAGHPNPTQDPNVRAVIRCLQAGRMPPKGKAQTPAPVLPAAPTAPAPARRAKAVTRQLLDRILDAVHRTSLDRRDRALLLLTFAAALKRSQVVALNVRDIAWTADVMQVALADPRSGNPRVLAIPVTGGELCAATAVRQYIEHLELAPDTPLFRSFNRASEHTAKRLDAAFVNEVLKTRLQLVGVDPRGYSGESLRLGRLQEMPRRRTT